MLGEYPRIPKLHDYFCESDRHYLIQEFINGSSLAEEKTWHEDDLRQLLLTDVTRSLDLPKLEGCGVVSVIALNEKLRLTDRDLADCWIE